MGYILYEGASLLDGQPIVAILTENSVNQKTGPMAQVWIMRSDMSPTEAIKSGDDSSVCGDCPHRPANLGSCYVNVWQAPRAVYDTYKRGVYTRSVTAAAMSRVARRQPAIRLGAYGDPAAVPMGVWDALTAGCPSWTGYTHQWRVLDAAAWAPKFMASADTAAEALEARAAGWRTFRVRRAGDPPLTGEFVCPAAAESRQAQAYHTCMSCRSCNGVRPGRDRMAHPVIIIHGSRAGRFNEAA